MPALKPTGYTARIVWLGHVTDRDAKLASDGVDSLAASFAGPEGEAHGGLTRPSCSRVLSQYPRDTEIRNVRQFSIVSQEELDEIAAAMEIDRLDPAWLGATMVIEGLPDFTHVPPSSRLQSGSGATLTVDMENQPCNLPARVIEDHLPGTGKRFKQAATGRRGVTAWVEREGVFKLGDTLTLHIPGQRAWSEAERAKEKAHAD